jgi:ribonucleoside-diphosphate reductase alpha chain
MLGMLFETGHPWMTFKDPCNLRSPQQHAGVVHSSNLCTEITLNTSEGRDRRLQPGLDQPAAARHENGVDLEKLERTIRTAVRMLDNVIDINYYSVDTRRATPTCATARWARADGLSGCAVQAASPMLRGGGEFADRSMEAISYFAIEASSDLAEERGSYLSFEGSLWSQGILPIDSLDKLEAERGSEYIKVDKSMTMDWDSLRERSSPRHAQLQRHGHRTDGDHRQHLRRLPVHRADLPEPVREIEPVRRVHRGQSLPGQRPQGTRPLGRVMVNDLKYYDGSVQAIERIPATSRPSTPRLRSRARWIVECASVARSGSTRPSR